MSTSACVDQVATNRRGTPITLSATEEDGLPFRRWGDPCGGPVPQCRLILRDNVEVAAAFGFTAPAPSLLTPLLPPADAHTVGIHVDVGKGGYMTVTGPPRGGPGIHCLKHCDAGGYHLLDAPTFTAHPASKKWKVKRWHKGCLDSETSCTLHVDQSTSVGVTFKRK